MFLKLATVALLPSLAIQGYQVKKNTLRLPEANGQREGTIGIGEKLSLLILGDSAAAGVGVEHQQDALLGHILEKLKDKYEIYYKLQAKTGDNSAQIITAATSLAPVHFDVVITSVGVNDVTELSSPAKWIKKQQALYSIIEKQFSPKIMIISGVPPMNLFPALPNPLAWLFGQYSKKMNALLDQFVQKKPNAAIIQYDMKKFQDLNLEMAKDGFHPSKEIYAIWAEQVIDVIKINLE